MIDTSVRAKLEARNVALPDDVSKLPGRRAEIDVPPWVEFAMLFRWVALVPMMFFAMITQVFWYAVLGLVLFLAIRWIAYLAYRQQNPIPAEIVFYSEEDGYCTSDGDADGDGGD